MDGLSSLLFLDRVRLAHLGTEATVEAEAEDPRSLAVAHLSVTSAAFRSFCTRDGRSPMQVQVRSHPKRDKRQLVSSICQSHGGVIRRARRVRLPGNGAEGTNLIAIPSNIQVRSCS